MTHSTRADHALGEEVNLAYADADCEPWAIAERHVLALEDGACESDPRTVDVHAVGREAADEARDAMAEAARCYGGATVADMAGERAFEAAFDAVEELVAESPLLEADDGA